MTTVNEQLVEINKQQNTLNLIMQMYSKVDPKTLYLTNPAGEYDMVRINAIRDFLLLEQEIVNATIESLFSDCVSGC
jgi:hypothetical protein